MLPSLMLPLSSFFNDPPPTETYPLSLHDALPILPPSRPARRVERLFEGERARVEGLAHDGALDAVRDQSPKEDRKSTRLNSSHRCISYAVFCLKKKKKRKIKS